jgi:hypothetical protein
MKVSLVLFNILICFFILLGILFFVFMMHEVYHVITMKGANGICLVSGKINDGIQSGDLFALTLFNSSKYENITEYTNARELSEKHVIVLECVLLMTIPLLIGFLIGKKKKNEKMSKLQQ